MGLIRGSYKRAERYWSGGRTHGEWEGYSRSPRGRVCEWHFRGASLVGWVPYTGARERFKYSPVEAGNRAQKRDEEKPQRSFVLVWDSLVWSFATPEQIMFVCVLSRDQASSPEQTGIWKAKDTNLREENWDQESCCTRLAQQRVLEDCPMTEWCQ